MYWETNFGNLTCVERSIILCPFVGGSTIGGTTVVLNLYNIWGIHV